KIRVFALMPTASRRAAVTANTGLRARRRRPKRRSASTTYSVALLCNGALSSRRNEFDIFREHAGFITRGGGLPLSQALSNDIRRDLQIDDTVSDVEINCVALL